MHQIVATLSGQPEAALLAISAPCGAPIRIAFAEALVRIGSNEKALQLADPVGAPVGDLARAQWIRGVALTGLGRFDAAEAALDEARKDPGRAFATELARARLEPRKAKQIRSTGKFWASSS